MRILAMIPSCRLCLVIFAVALMLLVLWSQIMSDMGSLSGTTYQSIVPRRRPLKGPNAPPVLAYWILGSGGEKKRMLRLLKAIYHPRNQYLLHLDSSAGDSERVELALLTQTEKVLREFGNVNVVGKSYGVNQMGASGLAAVLHAAALLLRISADWDWFIPLTTSDYPLFTQDDILYALSPLPRDLNFVGYTNETTWNKRQNVARIVVDPNLYLKEKTPVFYAAETREKPDAFQIFGGSPWMILSRGLLEHCVNGWDNLPRKLLMYLNNVEFPLESYFQTLLCNTPEFQNTTVNDDLRYIITENTTIGRREEEDDDDVGASIMARPFREDDPRMQEIDKQLLKREAEPGKWCIERGVVNETAGGIIMSNGNNNTSSKEEEFCSVVWGDVDSVEAGSRGVKLEKILTRIIQEKKSVTRNKDICLH